MPYTLLADREAVLKNIQNVKEPGDLVFLICKVILDTYISRPKFETIFSLKHDFVTEPKHNEFLRTLVRVLAADFTTSEVYTCAALAYDEFDRRVVSRHEDKKCLLNGDMPEFQEAIKIIDAFGTVVKVEEPVIEPVK